MSLRINHNLAALNAHRNLLETTSALNRSMQKLSSGYRINQGSDDPAGLVISEQFRAQIAGLNRAIDNSEGSISMIQTAEGAITEINSLLVSMRELAIHAANEGFNDTDQLAADQAEINNAITTIDRIAANTQFGTKKLLDGSNSNQATITSSNSSLVTVRDSFLKDGSHSIVATKVAESSATLNTTSLGVSLNNIDGNPYNLSEGIHTLNVIQASDVARKTSGQVAIQDAFNNYLRVEAAATQAEILSTATVATAATAGANAGTYTWTVNYQENGESPTGNLALQITTEATDTIANVVADLNGQIAANTQLAGKIEAYASSDGGTGSYLAFRTVNSGAQYSLSTVSTSYTGTGAAWLTHTAGASARGVAAQDLNFTVTTAVAASTATVSLAIATYTSTAALVTALDTALQTSFGTIAAGVGDIDAATYGDNADRIQFKTWDEGSDYKIKLNNTDTTGAMTGQLQYALNLTPDTMDNSGTDALVSFDNYTTAVSSVKYATTTNVTLANKDSGEDGRGTIELTLSNAINGLNLGNMLVDVSAARFSARLDGGPATTVVAGVDSTVYNADRSESLKLMYDLTSEGGTETINNTDRSLVFQIGANVGQTASISLRNMSANSLGRNLVGNMFQSLANIDVTTVQGAQDSQRIIDAAINEVSTTRGSIGSFQKNTLESNLRNLRIAAQNLTASESQIRDTDMAKEMSEFTKSQILVQAGTAMLAQANQVPQIVLSLFQ